MYTCRRARKAQGGEHVVEQASGLAHERLAARILLGAGRLADEEPVGVGVAHAGNRSVAACAHSLQAVQPATSAAKSTPGERGDARGARGVRVGGTRAAVAGRSASRRRRRGRRPGAAASTRATGVRSTQRGYEPSSASMSSACLARVPPRALVEPRLRARITSASSRVPSGPPGSSWRDVRWRRTLPPRTSAMAGRIALRALRGRPAARPCARRRRGSARASSRPSPARRASGTTETLRTCASPGASIITPKATMRPVAFGHLRGVAGGERIAKVAGGPRCGVDLRFECRDVRHVGRGASAATARESTGASLRAWTPSSILSPAWRSAVVSATRWRTYSGNASAASTVSPAATRSNGEIGDRAAVGRTRVDVDERPDVARARDTLQSRRPRRATSARRAATASAPTPAAGPCSARRPAVDRPRRRPRACAHRGRRRPASGPCARHAVLRQRLERGHRNERKAGAEREALGDAAGDAHAGERARTGAERDRIEVVSASPPRRACRRPPARGAPSAPAPRARARSHALAVAQGDGQPRRRAYRRRGCFMAASLPDRRSTRRGRPVQWRPPPCTRLHRAPRSRHVVRRRPHLRFRSTSSPSTRKVAASPIRRQGGLRRRRAARRAGRRATARATSRATPPREPCACSRPTPRA